MNKDRIWILGGIAVVVLIALGGYFLGISSVLTQSSAVSAQTAGIVTSNTKTQSELASLKQQFANIDSLKSRLEKLRGSIPDSASTSTFLNELAALAAKHHVTIAEVTIGSATVYAAPSAAPPAATSDTGTSTTPTDTPAPTTPTTPVAPVASPGGGLVLVPVVITSTGAFNDVRDFNGEVQKGTRLFFGISSQISAVADAHPQGILSGDIFTLAGTSDVVTQTTLVPTPDPTSTPTVTPTPTATSTTSSTGKSGGTTTRHTPPPSTPSAGPTTRP